MSSVLPMMRHLAENVLQDVPDDEPMTATIKRGVLTKMDDKYDRDWTHELLQISSFLDPRYRGDHISPPNLQPTKDKVVEEIMTLHDAGYYPSTDVGNGATTSVAQPPPPKKGTLGSIMGKTSDATQQLAALPVEERAKMELARYIAAEEVSGDTNPLIWWRNHEASFPLMAKLVKKYLRICATSTPSERLFSSMVQHSWRYRNSSEVHFEAGKNKYVGLPRSKPVNSARHLWR